MSLCQWRPLSSVGSLSQAVFLPKLQVLVGVGN